MNSKLLVLLALLAAPLCCAATRALPNIVLIYGDDMGIDSVGAFNDKLGLKTPHLDRLAAEGLSFMDAHSSSGVCSPSRYSLLTGRYHWRSRLKSGIVGAWERPLIEENRLTLPSMLRQHGYTTRMIGKWHLGFNWPKLGGGSTEKLAEIDFAGLIPGGPNAIGFDHWFGDDVPNWPPYAWRENDRLLGEITTTAKALGLTKFTGVGDGPAVANWDLAAVLPEYAQRCARFIHDQAGSKNPFFLYFPMPSPHTPIVPNVDWKGKSGISDYADFLLETDWAVGEVLRALDESGQAKDTLVIFTTDNGTSPKANFEELKSKGVHLTEHWRGNKADAYEGGHRVPFIVRWPGHLTAGRRSAQVITQTDIMATLADLVGHNLPANAAEDSLSLLPIFRSKQEDKPVHQAIVNHSASGYFAVRSGKWKLLFCRGSGGWSRPREADALKQGLPPLQLYDLEGDPRETTNLADQYPGVIQDLTAVLRRYVESGRSTPGPPQPNHAGALHWGRLPWKASAPAQGDAHATSSVTVSTPGDSSHPMVTITGPTTDGPIALPTPFPNIVRAWTANEKEGASSQLVRWSFNQDASDLRLHAPAGTGRIHLTVAETSGRLLDGTIVLSALDAKVVGSTAKLETHPGNHRIGFWARGDDYVTWTIELPDSAGNYHAELVYSRAGQAGAQAAVGIDDTTLPVKLRTTGSWYQYNVHPIGPLTLDDRMSHLVTVKSTLQIGPVMNLKALLLHPRTP